MQHTRDTLRKAAVEAVAAGVSGIMLFGVPLDEKKDGRGTAGTDPDGILQVALRDVRAEVGDDLVVMSDLCLDEFTDHGHCGVLDARTAGSTTTPPWSGTRRWPRSRPTRAPMWWAPAG